MTDKRMSNAERIERLHSDPSWLARIAERDRKSEANAQRHREEVRSLIQELSSVGIEYSTLSDMMNSSDPYKEAIPILFKHPHRPYSGFNRDLIARCLAVPDSRYLWRGLVDLYKEEPNMEGEHSNPAKSGLAVAIAAIATDDTLAELISLAHNRHHGSSRLLLLAPIRRSKSALAKDAIKSLASDPALIKEISSWKRKK